MTAAERSSFEQAPSVGATPRRVEREAAAAERRLTDFAAAHDLPVCPDTVCLYLAGLSADGKSGPALRAELRRLDRCARVSSETPFSQHEQVLRLVRGVHASSPARPGQRHYRPLYTEDVAALIAAVGPPSSARRDAAALLLADACELPAAVLRELRWHQVRLRPGSAHLDLLAQARAHSSRGSVEVPPGPPGLCPVEALWDLRRAWWSARGDNHVFGTDGRRPAIAVIAAAVATLPGRGGKWHHRDARCPRTELARLVSEALRDGPREHRDRSLLSLSFAACLTTGEARTLLLRMVRRVPGGLLLDLPSRPEPVAVPRAAASKRCPVRLWDAWVTQLSHFVSEPDMPAFPLLHYGNVVAAGCSRLALNDVVRTRCDAAGLDGRKYEFTSLRVGFIRSAARAGVPEDLIAAQAGLRYLDSVGAHRARELRISQSPAARVGL